MRRHTHNFKSRIRSKGKAHCQRRSKFMQKEFTCISYYTEPLESLRGSVSPAANRHLRGQHHCGLEAQADHYSIGKPLYTQWLVNMYMYNWTTTNNNGQWACRERMGEIGRRWSARWNNQSSGGQSVCINMYMHLYVQMNWHSFDCMHHA